jgi:aminopeptidase-like protein
MNRIAPPLGGKVGVDAGREIYELAAQIYPICRSITGDGVRKTLDCLRQQIDLTVNEVRTGTQVFDWTVPQEWNIRDAYIKNAAGGKILDFADSNLHVLNYSKPIHARMTLSELKTHLYTLPEQPDLIPYRTSYYQDRWGFCMAHRQLEQLPDEIYEVCIESGLADGHLSYGEYLHRGESREEFLLSAHICHPSLANDNCSGLALLTYLAKFLSGRRTHYTYRFIFAPGTIGAITWLARNEQTVGRIKHGLIVSCVGDGGGPHYKKSRRGNAAIDRVMSHVVQHAGSRGSVAEFEPYGYDERQYCSPGFNLPVGLLQRSKFGEFPEYHTSADNLQFIHPEHLAESFNMVLSAIKIVEGDARPRNTMPKCEPQLGRRGLYSTIGGDKDTPASNMALLWVLNLADGRHSLLEIAERAKMPFDVIAGVARRLQQAGLIDGLGVEPLATAELAQRPAQSEKFGQDLSRSEMTVGGSGHSRAKPGSSNRMPAEAAGS